MSEIKPSFWLAKVDHVSLTHEEGADALHLCATVSRGDCRLQGTDVPLYTAEQIAEAVAEERERIAEIWLGCKGGNHIGVHEEFGERRASLSADLQRSSRDSRSHQE